MVDAVDVVISFATRWRESEDDTEEERRVGKEDVEKASPVDRSVARSKSVIEVGIMNGRRWSCRLFVNRVRWVRHKRKKRAILHGRYALLAFLLMLRWNS